MIHLKRKYLMRFLVLLLIFALWTASVCFLDVAPIGPNESRVGFSSLNSFFHRLTGVNWKLYVLTDWLSLLPVGLVAVFGLFGFTQWIKRKNILKVDGSILALGGFYVAVMGVFLLFEKIVVNYRPVLIAGILEASYPSSTTMLVMCVMPTTILQIMERLRCGFLRRCLVAVIVMYTAFMVIARLISGVHWVTDIVGGLILSASLVNAYQFACLILNTK